MQPQTETQLGQWCADRLGSPPVEVFFAADSMSAVRGVLLRDGRRVAVKWRQASDRVLACAEAQRLAHNAGIDCPRLLAGPDRLDGAWLSAEEWRPDGSSDLPPDAATRYAALLRGLVVALDGLDPDRFAPPPPWAHYDHGVPGRVWAPAASPRWDPESEVVPSQLRRLAAAASKRLRAASLPQVVGHSDLNGLNVRWTPAGPIVHDWDSLTSRPECVLAGIVAANHVERPGAGAISTLATFEEFLQAYQVHRQFTEEEVELAWAAGVWVAAYNAAFEHLHQTPGPVSAQLLSDGDERLRRARADA